MTTNPPQPEPNSLPITDGGCVPVFDCRVILTSPDEQGEIHGRTANLAGITASANTERDVLMKLVKEFKAVVMKHHQEQTPIPWRDPVESPQSGESERWIPVHL